MNAVTWAVRAFCAAQAVFWAVIGALWVRDRFTRASRDIDQAIALVCKPCNGEEGPHTCGRKLPGPGQPQASGVTSSEDTGVRGWSDDEIAYLRGELKELPK